MLRNTLKIFLLISFVSLASCSVPKFTTIRHDSSHFSGPINNFDVFLYKSNIPQLSTYLKYAKFDEDKWYRGIAEGMKRNFKHNGQELSYKIINSQPSKPLSFIQSRPIYTPTLHLYIPKVAIRYGNYNVGLLVRASLYVPNRKKPVWVADASIAPYRASDEIPLKVLNELSRLKLIKLNKETAETSEGKKNSTFGGVLTN